MNPVQRIVIAGGGNAGISLAARLRRMHPDWKIQVVEPSAKHYYQPAWTMVGGGFYDVARTVRPTDSVMPKGVVWIKDKVAGFRPENNQVLLESGAVLEYDGLVVALGLKLRWDDVKGLPETLGKNEVCSVYDFHLAAYTASCVKAFKGGRALFTAPDTPVKCGGAPQKIMYLAADSFRKKGILDSSSVEFWSGGTRVFGVEKYEKTLKEVMARYGINTQFRVRLEAVDGSRKTAIFRGIGEENRDRLYEERFDLLHITPPQGPPDVVASSPLADDKGWVAANKHTLQHPRWPNIFALGDCAGIPVSRTGAAVRKQMPVVAENLSAVLEGRQPQARYNGYSSCPILTGYGRLVLAEFDYDLKPCETFPFDQSKERWTMFALKRYILPWLYWNKILPGKM